MFLSCTSPSCTTIITGIGESPNNAQVDNMAGDSTATFLMAAIYPNTNKKSSDGGYTWNPLSTLTLSSHYYFACADPKRWIAASAYIYYSNDFGLNWKDKRGNLQTISPFFVINSVKIMP